MATLQAVSGAGYPGVASLDILGNVIPHIGGGGGEDRSGEPQDPGAAGHAGGVRCQRPLPPRAGGRRPHPGDLRCGRAGRRRRSRRSWRSCATPLAARGPRPPSLPERPIVVRDEPDRPQPRPRRPRGWRHERERRPGGAARSSASSWSPLVHNTIRGAAGVARCSNAGPSSREGPSSADDPRPARLDPRLRARVDRQPHGPGFDCLGLAIEGWG